MSGQNPIRLDGGSTKGRVGVNGDAESVVHDHPSQIPPSMHTSGSLWIIIACSLGIHILCLVLGNSLLAGEKWENYPVHSSVEIAGGLIAFFVAMLLLSLDHRRAGTSYNTWISGALVGMGLLDGLHALVLVGQPFVWLHSAATFFGGVLFSMVWLPSRWAEQVSRWWVWGVFSIAMLLGMVSMVAPDLTPPMLVLNAGGERVFSSWAIALNVGGGVLLVVAAVRLLITYFRTRNSDDLLFFLHCLLFGSAAIMFQQSQLWDITWWGWHVLRLMAYAVALWFLVLTILREQTELTQMSADLKVANRSLEVRVAERTEELTALSNSLQQSNVTLETSNKELEQFAYVASHDLQEPLRKMSSFSSLLLEECGDDLSDDGREYIGVIIDGAARLKALVTDLLSFSRINRRGDELTSTNANECFDAAIYNLQLRLTESKAEVTCDALPSVVANVSQLTMLFQNLIENAIKYCDRKPRVHVGGRDVGEEFEFYVRDNGIGIEAKYFDRIFAIFKRLHSRHEYGGTGIGLANCRRIVERFGGKIWVESKPNEGSKFYFTIKKDTT